MTRGPRIRKGQSVDTSVMTEEPTVQLNVPGDSIPDDEGPRVRPRTRKSPKSKATTHEVNEANLKQLHEIVVIAVAGISAILPERVVPTGDEVDAIFLPAERIYLRHASVPSVSPDTQDALMLTLGLIGYASRVYSSTQPFNVRERRQSGGRQQSTGESDVPPTDNGRTPEAGYDYDPDAPDVAEITLRTLHEQSYRPESNTPNPA